MKMKTSELEGAALDWAVAKAGGHQPEARVHVNIALAYISSEAVAPYMPSTQWSQGGPLIEGEDYALPFKAPFHRKHLGQYQACTPGGFPHNGPTPLIAACRSIVAAKLGDTVDIPEELL